MTRPLPHVAAMSPYALAQLSAPPGKSVISLAQNECLRPPSPAVLAAAMAALDGSAQYPDPDWTALRLKLGELHGIDPAGILCGAGSLDLIGCIARAYAGPDRAVLASAHAYPFFRTAAMMAGARMDTAPEQDRTVSVSTLLQAVRADTAIVFVANPGNPTGTRIPASELERLRRGLQDDILLVIDEAYGEFADHLDPPSFDMVSGGNTIVLRTFSKAYSMAGFRVGWGLFPGDVAGQLRKVMNPNNIPLASQAAALAALDDQAYMRETCALTAALRETFGDRLRAAGFSVAPSFTNFLLIDLATAEAAQSADAVLRAQGVFLRPQGGAGLPQALRMTIADATALDAAAHVLETWKKERST